MNEQLKYYNRAQQRAILVNPWSYYGVMGRGTGKSIGILAWRSSHLAYAMPGASFAWYGNTYVNLQTNLIPVVIYGWKQLGYIEGVHFWRDIAPPQDVIRKTTFTPKYWKHTITWHTGTIFYLISDDRPDSARGHSFQHVFGDEIRLIKFEDMKETLFPAVRGERMYYANCPQFRGFTFTTDMPDRENGQWLLDMEKSMDVKQIEIIAKTAIERNKLVLKQLQTKDKIDKLNQQKMIDFVNRKLALYSYKSVYYDVSSTFVNIDALGLDQINTYLFTLGWNTFKTAVLNIVPDAVESMFYSGLNKRHFYTAVNYNYYNSFGIETVERVSVGDNDIKHDEPLDAGMDFGNMNSLTIGQEWGNEFKAHNFLYAVDPLKIKDLARMFTTYYKYHRRKILNLYYDRAANNRRPDNNISYAQEFRQEILCNDNEWDVNLMSLGWANVPHQERRMLWINILDDTNQDYPSFRLNEENCYPLKSSMQIAPTIVRDGVVKKDKTSERKKLEELPTLSTNPSDSIDYLIWGKYFRLLPKYGGAQHQDYGISVG